MRTVKVRREMTLDLQNKIVIETEVITDDPEVAGAEAAAFLADFIAAFAAAWPSAEQ